MICDFKTISYKQFESLSADILSVYLGEEFASFKEGKDSGIDISSLYNDKYIIGQCKRYNTTFQMLFKNLIKEKEKINCLNKNIEGYYLFTSIDLSLKEKEQIVSLFSPYMHSKKYIFDKKRIEKLLEGDKYESVRRKNMVLWVDSVNLLSDYLVDDLTIDGHDLINSINSHKQYYVETTGYKKALETLIKSKVVILTGTPGVGKTTTSEMLVLYVLGHVRNCKIIYSADCDTQVIKNNLKATHSPAIILMDDFIGRNILDLTDNYSKSLKSIINYVCSSKDLYLIMNSRIAIFNQAMESIKFSEGVNPILNYVIDLSSPSKIDKAEIFKKHLIVSKVSQDCINSILVNKNYLKIINHINYTGRNISYLTNEKEFRESGKGCYFTYCKELLDNPGKIWDTEIKANLSQEDRLLLETFYTLGSFFIDERICKQAYSSLLNGLIPKHDKTINQYENSLSKLTNTYIKKIVYPAKEKPVISLVNPSILDYLKDFFRKMEDSDKEMWLHNSLFFEQLLRICSNLHKTIFFRNLMQDENYLKLKYASVNSDYPVVLYCSYGKCLDTKYKDALIRGLCNFPFNRKYTIGSYVSEDIVKNIYENGCADYYDFASLDVSTIILLFNSLLSCLDIEKALSCFSVFETRKDYNSILKSVLLEYYYNDFVNNELDDYIESAFYEENNSSFFGLEDKAKEYIEYNIIETQEQFPDYELIKQLFPKFDTEICDKIKNKDLSANIELFKEKLEKIEHEEDGFEQISIFDDLENSEEEFIEEIFSELDVNQATK